MKIIYEPVAYEELREAIVWYLAEAGQRQAEALSRDIDARLALLMQHPQLGTPGASNMRRMPLRVFPYTLHYRVEGAIIRIFAVAHQKRRPGYWRNR